MQASPLHLHATFKRKSPFASSTKDVLRFQDRSPSTRQVGVTSTSALKASASSRKSLPKHRRGLHMLCIKQKRQNTSADKCSEATLKARPNRSESNSSSNAVHDSQGDRFLRSSPKLFWGVPGLLRAAGRQDSSSPKWRPPPEGLYQRRADKSDKHTAQRRPGGTYAGAADPDTRRHTADAHGRLEGTRKQRRGRG